MTQYLLFVLIEALYLIIVHRVGWPRQRLLLCCITTFWSLPFRC